MSGFILPVFIAGVLTFLAPCTLPLVPGYLAFISGATPEELHDPEKRDKLRWRIFSNGLLYVLGFSVVFILMGMLFGLGGQVLLPLRQWLTRIGGIFVIFFGVFLLFGSQWKALRFLQSERKLHVSQFIQPGKHGSAFILGATFAFGWSPCVGPILGSVLLLASTAATVWHGAGLLAVFSLGLAVPFLLLAAFVGSAQHYLQKFNRYLSVVSKIGGVLLIGIGLALVTNHWEYWLTLGYDVFHFMGYERILDYL